MKLLALSIGVACVLASTSFEASAAYCRARGPHATGWGRSESSERAMNMAMAHCMKHGSGCRIVGCMR